MELILLLLPCSPFTDKMKAEPILHPHQKNQIPGVPQSQSILFDRLVSLDLLQKLDTKIGEDGLLVQSWKMHPLLSFKLKTHFYDKVGLYLTLTVDQDVWEKIVMPCWYAFSDFYAKRLYDFSLQLPLEPGMVLSYIRLELKNILTAFRLQLHLDSFLTQPSFASSFALLSICLCDSTLCPDDLSAILLALKGMIDRFEVIQNREPCKEFEPWQLRLYFVIITQLIEYFLAGSKWSEAVVYAARSSAFLAKTEKTASTIGDLVPEVLAQTQTVNAWSIYAEDRFSDAATVFRSNMTQEIYLKPVDFTPTMVNVLFLKRSNQDGLIRSLSGDPNATSEELIDAFKDVQEFNKSFRAVDSGPFLMLQSLGMGFTGLAKVEGKDSIEKLNSARRELEKQYCGRRTLTPNLTGLTAKSIDSHDYNDNLQMRLAVKHIYEKGHKAIRAGFGDKAKVTFMDDNFEEFQHIIRSSVGARDLDATTTFFEVAANIEPMSETSHMIEQENGRTVSPSTLITVQPCGIVPKRHQGKVRKALMANLTESMRRGEDPQKQAEYHEWAFSSAVYEDSWPLASKHYQEWRRLLSQAFDISTGYWHAMDEIRHSLCIFHLDNHHDGIQKMKAAAQLAKACKANRLISEALELVALLQIRSAPDSLEGIESYCQTGLYNYSPECRDTRCLRDGVIGNAIIKVSLKYIRARCEVTADGKLVDVDSKLLDCHDAVRRGVGPARLQKFFHLYLTDVSKWGFHNLDVLEEALFAP